MCRFIHHLAWCVNRGDLREVVIRATARISDFGTGMHI